MGRNIKGIYYKTDSGSSPVEKWLESLSPTVEAYVEKQMIQLEKFWGKTKLSFVTSLRNGLFEITMKVDNQWPRVIFICVERDKIVYLHGFIKKKNKTPHNEIKVALNRRKKFLEQLGGKK